MTTKPKDAFDPHRLAFSVRRTYQLHHMDLLVLAADFIVMAALDSAEDETPRELSERLFKALPDDEDYREMQRRRSEERRDR